MTNPSNEKQRFSFAEIDRRLVYVFVALTLAIPLILEMQLEPAPMETADAFYKQVAALEPQEGKIVLIAADWGPTTKAENEPQTEVAIEHLMRKRIPFALISVTPYATPFLRALPRKVADRLMAEQPGEEWTYGEDWVNFGFQTGGRIMIQSVAKAENIADYLKADARGTPLKDVPMLKGVGSISDIMMLMQFTGLVGTFEDWLEMFHAKGYQPTYLHGCTSITIAEAYNYFVTEQIVGLHEGVAGAAWYEKLLNEEYPERIQGTAIINNTSLAYAHLLLLAFIIFGEARCFVCYHGVITSVFLTCVPALLTLSHLLKGDLDHVPVQIFVCQCLRRVEKS